MKNTISSRNWELPPEVKTLTVNEYEMAYLERGEGTPLVLVHGSLNDYRAWEYQMASFCANYRTIALSLRHAFPEHWNGVGIGFSVRQHADDLSGFIKALEAGPVHLVAHSRGGDVALVMAAEHSQLVRSLVLADPAPFDDMLPRTSDAIAESEKRKAIVKSAIDRIQQGNMDSGLEHFTDAVSTAGNWEKLSASAKQIRRDNAWSLISLVTDSQEPFNCSDAKKIEAPILLLTGEKSPPLYGMMHASLEQCLNHYHKAVIPDASHGMQRDNPHVFNATVLDFLMNY